MFTFAARNVKPIWSVMVGNTTYGVSDLAVCSLIAVGSGVVALHRLRNSVWLVC